MNYKGKNDCETCSGEGKIFAGMTSKFNARNMELVDFDVYVRCECAESIDPEEEKYRYEL